MDLIGIFSTFSMDNSCVFFALSAVSSRAGVFHLFTMNWLIKYY